MTNYQADMQAIADSRLGYPLGKHETEDPDDICACDHYRDEHNANHECTSLTLERRAKCSCPKFIKA